jgi:hypothetical protein
MNCTSLCINTLIQIINKGENTANEEDGREKDRKMEERKKY